MVEAIGAESGVCTEVKCVVCASCGSRQVEEAKYGKENDGKREGIEGNDHFDESINLLLSAPMQDIQAAFGFTEAASASTFSCFFFFFFFFMCFGGMRLLFIEQ